MELEFKKKKKNAQFPKMDLFDCLSLVCPVSFFPPFWVQEKEAIYFRWINDDDDKTGKQVFHLRHLGDFWQVTPSVSYFFFLLLCFFVLPSKSARHHFKKRDVPKAHRARWIRPRGKTNSALTQTNLWQQEAQSPVPPYKPQKHLG